MSLFALRASARTIPPRTTTRRVLSTSLYRRQETLASSSTSTSTLPPPAPTPSFSFPSATATATATGALPASDAGPPEAPPGAIPFNPLAQSSGSTSLSSQATNVIQHRLYVKSGPNNTQIVITNERGNPISKAGWSGGSVGFKGSKKGDYEAGYQCVVRAFKKLEDLQKKIPTLKVEILFKGFGDGRDAVYNALMTSEGEMVRPMVNRLTDQTPIKIGGTRAKKTRRL